MKAYQVVVLVVSSLAFVSPAAVKYQCIKKQQTYQSAAVFPTPTTPPSLVADEQSEDGLQKRSQFVEVTRQARIKYTCPFAGVQWKTFKWKVSYSYANLKLSITALEGIDTWNHMSATANDFMTMLHARVYRPTPEYCCIYTYEAQIIGAIYQHPRGIYSRLWSTNSDPGSRMKITEKCTTLQTIFTAPVHNCEVLRVSQGRT